MSSNKHLALAVGLMAAVTGLGGLVLVWPAYRDAAWIGGQVEDLHKRGENYDVQAQIIARLTAELDESTKRVHTGLKAIPESADIAGLMQVLSLPVDGFNVRDQTFTAGEPVEAAPGAGLPTMVQPLTVEMDARFGAVFSLLRAAESMDRLLRIASVKVVCDRRREEEQPYARATVVIEAVYEPRAEEGG
jgi:hypothetical protein